jgi:hypothetical protein
MTATFNPQTLAEQARKNYRDVTTKVGHLGLDTSVPETVRAMAEKVVDQSREAYGRSKDALDASVATLERTFDAAGQGAVAFNRKFIDIAQRNVNSGFDLAKSLAGANPNVREHGPSLVCRLTKLMTGHRSRPSSSDEQGRDRRPVWEFRDAAERTRLDCRREHGAALDTIDRLPGMGRNCAHAEEAAAAGAWLMSS